MLLGHAELTVSELVYIVKQSQPRISRHLKLLADAGLIERNREGAWVFYRAQESGPIAQLKDTVTSMALARTPATDRDLERLEDVRSQRRQQAQSYFAANAAEWNRLRSLHTDDADVEAAMLALLKGRTFKEHLDIGTGTGRVLELLAPFCERGLGIDMSGEMLGVARARLSEAGLRRTQVRLADLFSLPVADETCDLVTVHQVLHYLDDPARALSEAARALAPGGLLLIADFAPHMIESLRTDHQHRRLGFDAAEVEGWLMACGLTLSAQRDLPAGRPDGLTVSLWLASTPERALRRRPIKVVT
ncbi:MAG TPA: ArsR family transcriptional regulator [Alphaproteobacteria bacterium]|nr:ArsR family transcriptional regulator [Alphaproteobacteria bacterium]HAJ46721.1 ArsR family transcriptional regulator [Alphaproteobacteria bacterium]